MLHFLLVVVGLHLVLTQGQTTTNPIAPSLPFLSEEEEEDRLDGIVNRFMLFDTGNLAGPAGARALEDFQKLGNEAIPALLRGLRKSAVLAQLPSHCDRQKAAQPPSEKPRPYVAGFCPRRSDRNRFHALPGLADRP